jgi:hypothetical protein
MSGLPATATNETFKNLLEESKVPNLGCHVEIDPVTKQCKSGNGSVVFSNRADCKITRSHLTFFSPRRLEGSKWK